MGYTHLLGSGLTVLWITTSALQYGFHIASLNSISASVICDAEGPGAPKRKGSLGLGSCVDMSEAAFGTVTSAYTVGGLVGSLLAANLVGRWEKKGTAVRSAGVLALGACAVSLGSSLWVLVVGRVLIGISCGIATVLVPLYLSSVAPPAIAGNIGILTQVSINIGIFAAQGFSLPLSTPGTGNWRFVSLISAAVAIVQMLSAPLMPESGGKETNGRVYDVSDDDEERAPLAREHDSAAPRRKTADESASLSVWQVLTSGDPAICKPLWTLVLVMLFQQLSGINAVMYYSTSILTAVNPSSAKTVSLFVTLVNLIATLPSIYLIDRLGRRTLLLISLLAMSASTAVLGWAINTSHFYVASAFIILFVVGFSLGLGPVPFVLVGEMPVEEAKSATASIAVATNWTCNLLVGVSFLPLRDYLANSNSGGGGSGTVFFVFTAFTALGAIVMSRMLR
ncbi:hypothetical protein JCM10213_001821 [Rhodosporidiobolus nylandii]